MDVYGGGGVSSTADSNFPIDDLLDFSNEQLFSSSSSSSTDSDVTHTQNYLPTPLSLTQPIVNNGLNYHHHFSTDFTNDLCAVPSDDVAELEWLSQFVDDSFTDFPTNDLAGTIAFRSEASPETGKAKRNGGEHGGSLSAAAAAEGGEVRRCTHCASEKTPQWRTGPLGPKTLCNACGVRFKSGRLVPEYRPAASPTFVLTQHSNSHRKVMELRRQKELTTQQQQEQMYHHHRQVC
ncbi:hypothetical protein ACB092_11G164300 [Castanea dentata]